MQSPRTHQRPAYTLLEIILVMVIVVIVAALSVPVMQNMITDARINGAADMVRGRMAEARARSMDEGRPWKLAYIANTGFFQLAPEESDEWQNSSSQDIIEKADLIRDELPKEIIFATQHEAIFNSTTAPQPGVGWEIIAVYLPDGSAREDTTTYFGKPAIGPMRARLRALTGTVTIETYKVVLADQP